MAKVLVPLADGCEELEAVTIIDLLRRAGIEVVTAGLKPGIVLASRGVRLVPDLTLDVALQEDYDMVVLPGGMPGASHLKADARIIELLKKMAAAQKFTAAICAAPMVLAEAGILDGKRATCYPGSVDARPRRTRRPALASACQGCPSLGAHRRAAYSLMSSPLRSLTGWS